MLKYGTTRQYILLGLLLLFVLVAGAAMVSNEIDQRRPAIPVTFETIASHPRDKVSIEGLIGYLGLSVNCEADCFCISQEHGEWCCYLDLVPLDQSTGGSEVILEIKRENSTAVEHPTNSFYLPHNYESTEFSIFASDGSRLRLPDPIRAIGKVTASWTDDGGGAHVNLCVMEIEAAN